MIHYYYYSATLDIYVTIGKNEYEFNSLYIVISNSDGGIHLDGKIDMRIP